MNTNPETPAPATQQLPADVCRMQCRTGGPCTRKICTGAAALDREASK